MIFREIGRKIQQAREESGLTQEELALRLGCTQSALSNYELGKRRMYLSLLSQIAQVLHKPLEYFMESSPEDKGDGAAALLCNAQLKEILLSAATLSQTERKLVLDFIIWRRNRK